MNLLPLVVLYCVGWALLRYWGLRANHRFFGELDRRGKTGLSLSAELDAVTENPLRLFATSPRRAVKRIRAIVESQEDPELERLRKECLRRRLVSAVFFWTGMAALVVAALAHWP